MYVHIEYCEKWNYKPEFDRVSKIILSINSLVDISFNNSEPRTGSFEVTINGKMIFSKLQNGRFPSESEICSWFS